MIGRRTDRAAEKFRLPLHQQREVRFAAGIIDGGFQDKADGRRRRPRQGQKTAVGLQP